MSFNMSFLAVFAIVLTLGALAAYMSEKVGVVNIAIEGTMVISAFVYVLTYNALYSSMGGYSTLLAIFPAILTGMAVSMAFALIVVKTKANHIIAGTFINVLAPGLTVTLAIIIEKSSNVIYSIQALPMFIGINIVWWIIMIFTAAITCGIYFFMHKTKYGIRAKASGDNPSALMAAGENINKVRYINLLISGGLAGMAGGIVLANFGNAFRGSVFGFGFLSLVVLVIGQWKIKRVALFAFLLSVFLAFIKSQPSTSFFTTVIPKEISEAIPYILPLIMLAIFKDAGHAPKAAGKIVEIEGR